MYEKRKATPDDPLESFFCSMGVACAAAADELACSDLAPERGDAGYGDVAICGDSSLDDAPPRRRSPPPRRAFLPSDDAALEIEGGESVPASLLSGGADANWIRLGACAPDDRDAPHDHRPRPASLDQSYASFRRADVQGQIVTRDWHVAPDPDADANGWSYGAALATRHWHAARTRGRVYRRQIWHRYAVRPRPGGARDAGVEAEL